MKPHRQSLRAFQKQYATTHVLTIVRSQPLLFTMTVLSSQRIKKTSVELKLQFRLSGKTGQPRTVESSARHGIGHPLSNHSSKYFLERDRVSTSLSMSTVSHHGPALTLPVANFNSQMKSHFKTLIHLPTHCAHYPVGPKA